MAINDNGGTGMYMPVAPAGYGNGGFGGDWGSWIILFLIFGMFGGGGMWGGNGMNGIYPWLNQSDQINSGFQNQMLGTQAMGIQNAITSGFGDVQTALCGGFAGVNATVNTAQNALAQQMYANQIAELERSFSTQTAILQQMNALQGQLSQCCCNNQLATVQTQNIVQTEGAATRLAIQNQTQQILDKQCQQEIDALKSENLALQNQLNMATFNASQVAQTAQLISELKTTATAAAG